MKTLKQLHEELANVDTNFADWSASDRYALKKTLEQSIAYVNRQESARTEIRRGERCIDLLEKKMDQSLIRPFKRGVRRYFPITALDKHGWKYLFEAFEIIYGRQAKDRGEVGMAILFHGLDSYVEVINGKLMVRTVYKVDWSGDKPILLHH